MIGWSDKEHEFFVDAFDQVPMEAEETPFFSIDLSEFGVDPRQPTKARPGSDEKVRMLAARYATGLPLWHEEDCYDHSEAEDAEPLAPMGVTEFEDEQFDDEDCELIGELD
ncbi:MAG TPA: hypothetical protein EYP14_13045 [Planctomycetaceae bacterium]|nr:hypothetical protein [Planctomycetaceae bacterium]